MRKWIGIIALLVIATAVMAQTTVQFATYITGLPTASSVNSADVFYILQSSTSKQVAASKLFGAQSIQIAVRSSSSATVTVSATTDYFLCLDPTSNAITVTLPSSPATGLTFLIKDCTGQASVHSITITPASGNIDGSGIFTMATNFQSTAVTYSGTQWSVN